jgi:hypothetical protein
VASTTPAIPKHQQRGCFTAPMQVRQGWGSPLLRKAVDLTRLPLPRDRSSLALEIHAAGVK